MMTFEDYVTCRNLTEVNVPKAETLSDNAKPRERWYDLLIDCAETNKKAGDEKVVLKFIKDLLRELKMKPLGEPHVYRVDSNKHGKGISVLQAIETSSVTYHQDAANMRIFLDIFSCKKFNAEGALKLFEKYFEPKKIGSKWIIRDA